MDCVEGKPSGRTSKWNEKAPKNLLSSLSPWLFAMLSIYMTFRGFNMSEILEVLEDLHSLHPIECIVYYLFYENFQNVDLTGTLHHRLYVFLITQRKYRTNCYKRLKHYKCVSER